MALIKAVLSKTPSIGVDTFIAENATIVGNVTIGNHCSVWFNAVIRGDVNYIRIGDYSNIQDGVVIHGTYLKNGTDIGSYVNVGHNAIVHGCTLRDHCLVGMGAIVMDKAVIEEYVIVAAGAVVLENMVCESGFLYAGVPAKKIKPLTAEQRTLLDKLPHNYVLYASWFGVD
ncbi:MULTISPECIES: gamma carbonic anhydrase family protein [Olivibacter]|jgi:carbonic anhydrase/acetyltransferase-like protein (isoleucine patch superfamily)|uniref:Transferase hexapeptide repeat containing protein n=3 Tax=Sphingobacteriaceae TaxID=84566 RepID=F4CEP7_SPHS2|nr:MULTISPECIES: gamma carbonic anhydrase family protein [Olivibacter]MCL4637349.1 gamma carbonic anhydrase family protein [Olivibacter sp. UJ_SKK_5.1]MDM8177444.1 gamma carbonic anhydrase family protein [Olivibacter sp. 47]MDX3912159.1 gamma carbonic anhydrase family protein [Pseudosphingobacterium sp.]QEK99893.1 gamma carbonic anhydrase family protein [Olivibacter sp. LS-1]